MNNNNRSKQTLDVPSSNANGKHSDSESEKELYEPTPRNVEQQIDTVSELILDMNILSKDFL